ncbi:MAG: hypothetical protein ABL907_25990, partial [Hyphomicrobium sp.]
MMTVDSVIAPELLTAEIAAIEDLLVHYEDWRALGQLESRERQGDLPASVSTSAIKGMLYEKLASNPLFLRRQALLKELERLTELAKQAANELRLRAMNAGEGDDGDDFTRIRGVDARLERRLNALNVRAYEQIAGWTEADVHYVASTLGLGDLIVSQMWIEQAGLLAAARWRHAGAATEDRRATSPAAITATGSKQTVETNVVEPKFSETLKVESPGLEKSDGAKLGVAPVEPVKPSVRQPAAVPPAAKAPVSSAPPLPAVPPVTVPQPLAASVPAVIGKPQSDAQTVPLSAPQPAAHNTPQAQSKLGVDARDKAKVAPAAGAGTPSGVEPASPANKVLEPAATPASPAPSVPAGFPHTKTEASATAAHAPVKPLPAELDVKVATPSSPAGSDKVAASAANGSPTASPPPAAAPEIDYGALVPAHPLAARRYGGTVLEPLDPGVLNGAPPPPKPRPAAAYAQSDNTNPAGAPNAADIEPVAPPRPEKSAAEILDQSLPPLQL